MPLNKETFKNDILSIFSDMESAVETAPKNKEWFAEQLANKIDAYIKTATVTVTVETTGSASAQTGTGTGGLS